MNEGPHGPADLLAGKLDRIKRLRFVEERLADREPVGIPFPLLGAVGDRVDVRDARRSEQLGHRRPCGHDLIAGRGDYLEGDQLACTPSTARGVLSPAVSATP